MTSSSHYIALIYIFLSALTNCSSDRRSLDQGFEQKKDNYNSKAVNQMMISQSNYLNGLLPIKRVKRCSLTNSFSSYKNQPTTKLILTQYNRDSKSKFKFKSLRNASKTKSYSTHRFNPFKGRKKQQSTLKIRKTKTQLLEKDMLLAKRDNIEDVFGKETKGFIDLLSNIEKIRGINLSLHKEHLQTEFKTIGKKLSCQPHFN